MNEFIGKINGQTLSFKYDNVAKQIYIYERFKNKPSEEVGITKCLSYDNFVIAVKKLKTDNPTIRIIKDLN